MSEKIEEEHQKIIGWLCIDCGTFINLPADTIDGEIIACPKCGTYYVMRIDNIKITFEKLKHYEGDF